MATVEKVNLKIPQGTTFRYDFVYIDANKDPIPLTGYTARCQFRGEEEDAIFFFEGTTETGEISIDAPSGVVSLYVAPAVSTAWTTYEGVYDLELIAPNNDVIRLVQGNVLIDREVTR